MGDHHCRRRIPGWNTRGRTTAAGTLRTATHHPPAKNRQTWTRLGLRPRSQVLLRRFRRHHGRRLFTPRKSRIAASNASSHSTLLFLSRSNPHQPKFLPQFIAKQKIRDADVVTGTRYISGGGVYGWDLKRKVISRGANLLARIVLWPGVSDVTGSFRLYKRPVLERLINETVSRGYVFQMEIIVRAKATGYIVDEVPITFVDRVFGESKLGGSEIVQYAQGIWMLFRTV